MDYCIICGKRHEKGKCDPKVLKRIDATMKSDRDFIANRGTGRSYSGRLKDGFAMSNGTYQ